MLKMKTRGSLAHFFPCIRCTREKEIFNSSYTEDSFQASSSISISSLSSSGVFSSSSLSSSGSSFSIAVLNNQ